MKRDPPAIQKLEYQPKSRSRFPTFAILILAVLVIFSIFSAVMAVSALYKFIYGGNSHWGIGIPL